MYRSNNFTETLPMQYQLSYLSAVESTLLLERNNKKYIYKKAGFAGIAPRARIGNVEIKNIGSAGQGGFTQCIVVRTVTEVYVFLTEPNLVPRHNCRLLKGRLKRH